jgi:branched-chain amino acid transport system permease protein
MTLDQFLQHITNGLSLGSLYALIAIGYTMVYGILRLINFAHGDIFMLGGYIAFYCVTLFIMPWWVAFVVSFLLTGAFGVLLERVAYKPLRNSPKISLMISAVGASFLLENLATVIFGGRPKAFVSPDFFNNVISIGNVKVVLISILVPIVTAVCLGLLVYLVYYTINGMAMRAVSTDLAGARLMGIDVNKVVSFTFAIGSVLAAIGGVMWAIKYPQLNPTMGIIPGIKCFIAAVIGGIGNITGAVLGGLVLGFIEVMMVAIFPALTGYRDAFAFVMLILVLMLKPSGLLGKNQIEKV